jgi:stage II sporulation protein AA (anti-sigma F factor antagonist)
VVVRGTADGFARRARVPSDRRATGPAKAQFADPYEPEMEPASFDELTLDGGARVLIVSGELDTRSVGGLRRRLEAALSGDRPSVVVDLSAVTHMDSSGLSELLSGHQRAAALHGGLAVVVATPALRRTLEIRGVDGVLTIAATREEAFAALRRTRGA